MIPAGSSLDGEKHLKCHSKNECKNVWSVRAQNPPPKHPLLLSLGKLREIARNCAKSRGNDDKRSPGQPMDSLNTLVSLGCDTFHDHKWFVGLWWTPCLHLQNRLVFPDQAYISDQTGIYIYYSTDQRTYIPFALLVCNGSCTVCVRYVCVISLNVGGLYAGGIVPTAGELAGKKSFLSSSKNNPSRDGVLLLSRQHHWIPRLHQ